MARLRRKPPMKRINAHKYACYTVLRSIRAAIVVPIINMSVLQLAMPNLTLEELIQYFACVRKIYVYGELCINNLHTSIVVCITY